MIPLLLSLVLVSPAEEFEIESRPIEWEDLDSKHFDQRWRLPDVRKAGGRDVLAEMKKLASLRFEARDAEGRVYRSLGDLALAMQGRKNRSAWLDALLRSSPKLSRDWGPALRELLLDSTLRKADWDPDDDSPLDGILLGDVWDLKKEGRPWKTIEVDAEAQQSATIIRADLATIKAAENDYRRYYEIPGSSYEAIYPVANAYVRGEDARGAGFAALKLYFRCELPLWYPDYSCDLRLLNRVDDAGRLVCDIYSTSEDFYWLAGRDVYLPLEAGEGSEAGRAGYLVVRQYGFDLDGVPDKSSHVQAALRQSLGSLKLRAEKLAGPRGSAKADVGPARVPEFSVLGRR